MSRSNPTSNNPNPARKWFDYNGETGAISYYDKEKKEKISVAEPFVFILLDELATVKGWHDSSDSGIFSNEVHDVRKDSLTVKAFKGGVIAEGFYASIKDRVNAAGGYYAANLYIAFKDEGALVIGSIQFKGAALGAWMEFAKANRSSLYKKAVKIKGHKEGKKGKVTFRTPLFHPQDISPETDQEATGLDKELQKYLASYMTRNRVDQVSQEAHHDAADENQEPEDRRDHSQPAPDDLEPDDSQDIPF